jgi:DNA-binding transcriptional LysR family regulator
VRIFVDMTNRRVDLIEEGFDIALRVRTPPLEASDLAMRKIADTAGMLVASPALWHRHERPTHPRDLAHLPTLSMTTAGDKYVWHFREQDCTPITVTHTPCLMTDSFNALRAAATAGVGVAYLPQFVVQESVSTQALERVLPEFSLPPAVLHAVFPSRRGMVPAVRAIIDALAEGLQETGLS